LRIISSATSFEDEDDYEKLRSLLKNKGCVREFPP
jgi:hypothetical protein